MLIQVRDHSFDGTNYVFQKIGMEAYLMSLGVDVQISVLVEYAAPITPPIDPDGMKNQENNENAKNSIAFGLNQSKLVKVMHCQSAKEVWDKLKNGYEGDEKVNKNKLQAFIMRFKSLRMNEEEKIT